MPKNTFLLVIVLTIIAAIIIGVQFFMPQNASTTQNQKDQALSSSPKLIRHTSSVCGIAFDYPETFTKLEAPGGSVVFTNPGQEGQTAIMTCQKEIPKPTLTPENIDTIQIGSVSAKLYHDTEATIGTRIDKLIFTHPIKNIEIYIAGKGSIYEQIISTITIL